MSCVARNKQYLLECRPCLEDFGPCLEDPPLSPQSQSSESQSLFSPEPLYECGNACCSRGPYDGNAQCCFCAGDCDICIEAEIEKARAAGASSNIDYLKMARLFGVDYMRSMLKNRGVGMVLSDLLRE